MTTQTLAPQGGYAPAKPAGASAFDRINKLIRGRTDDPRWARPALFSLLLATAVLYLWGLGASGWANSFYSAAAQAGSQSWKAMFFGSSDAANSITVDKTPASLWIMALSVRVFGLSSWSILVPQALEGVAGVGVLYLAVRRTHGLQAGLLAGLVMATTPVAALMFRFNNPDALLVLLLTIAGYCVIRALESASTKWLVWVGVLVGFGFLTKMLQAMLVVPGFALVYLVCAPTGLGRRIRQLLAAGAAMVVAAGWWMAIVSLIPASSRPYIGGSQTNSILQLTLGYNGLGRLTGNETGSVGGNPTGGGMWGTPGITRLFGSEMGSEIAWMLPTSLLLLGAGLWFTRGGRSHLGRAALLVWGGWLIVTGLTFSYASGIIHPYYTVALAPAIGGVVGIGAWTLWQRRHDFAASISLALVVGATTAWQFIVLSRDASWQPWLRYSILIVGVAVALLIIVISRLGRRLTMLLGIAAVVISLAGQSAWAVATAAQPHTGAIPSTGPAGAARGGFGAGAGPGGNGRFAAPPQGFLPPGTGTTGGIAGGTANGSATANGSPTAPGQTAHAGGVGGLLDSATPSAALVSALTANASTYTWVAATVGSNSAAGLQLATQKPVMPIGGFNGSDPSPTLAQFKTYVAAGKIHYFIAGGGFGGARGGSSDSGSISTWVAATFTSSTIAGTTVYDLTSPITG